MCSSFGKCVEIMVAASAFLMIVSSYMQDVWTELGRPDGIHQKQVFLTPLL